MSNLKMDDSYITAMEKLIGSWAENLQSAADTYLDVLTNITVDGIIEGETASAMQSFKGYAEAMKNVIKETGTGAKTLCNTFASDMEKVDSSL